MEWFKHDTDASFDSKIMELRMECGGEAIDAYWMIIERLYKDEEPLMIIPDSMLEANAEQKLSKRLANAKQMLSHSLLIEKSTLDSYVFSMIEIGLLEVDYDSLSVHSSRVSSETNSYNKKCETLRQNARKSKSKANAEQKLSKSKANAEQKLSKSRDIKNRKEKNIYNGERGAGVESSTPRPPCETCGSTRTYRNTQTGRICCSVCNEPVEVVE